MLLCKLADGPILRHASLYKLCDVLCKLTKKSVPYIDYIYDSYIMGDYVRLVLYSVIIKLVEDVLIGKIRMSVIFNQQRLYCNKQTHEMQRVFFFECTLILTQMCH